MISDKIRTIREKKGISMRQAALDMGFPYTTYVNYEKNVSEPNSEAIVKIAVYYGVSADYLLGVEQSEQKECPSPVEDEREAYRNMLSELTEDELKEMKNFTSYLRWKREHPGDASET